MEPIFFVSTENSCNNNCLGCADDNSRRPLEGRSSQEIIYDMQSGARMGYKKLHLAGGEVTCQENLFELLKMANMLYDSVYITTNGRMLAYRGFAKKLAPLAHVNITLAGANQQTHDSWTRVPGSFAQSIEGIENLSRLSPSITINYLVWAGSISQVGELMQIMKSMGVTSLRIFNLVPLGRALSIYRQIAPRLGDLIAIESCIDPKLDTDLEDFPRCAFEKGRHVDTSGLVQTDTEGNIENYSIFAARQIGLDVSSSLRIDPSEMRKRLDSYRVKPSACKGCARAGWCRGVFSEYVKEFGDSEIWLLRELRGL